MSQQKRIICTRNSLDPSVAKVFERHGYVDASLNEAGAGAEVSRGALHFHFETEVAMAEVVEGDAARSLHQVMDRVPFGDMSALQALTDLSRDLARPVLQDVVVRADSRFSCDTALRTSCDAHATGRPACTGSWPVLPRKSRSRQGVLQEGSVFTVVATATGFAALSRANRK